MCSKTATEFSFATHNGTVTVSNPATGVHQTFQVRTQKPDARFAPGERIVSLLTGSDNDNDYTGFGFLSDTGRISVWRRKSGGIFDRYAKLLENLDAAIERWGLTAQWSVKCRRCNRTLTTPESIESGIGPICEGRE